MKTSDAAKSELQSLLFEKSLASEAIAHSYEAAQKRKIDLAERNKLLLKYRQQISFYNKKIEELQSVADLVELSQGRDRLVSLIETKITAIDSKLFELSQRLGISLEALRARAGDSGHINGSSTYVSGSAARGRTSSIARSTAR